MNTLTDLHKLFLAGKPLLDVRAPVEFAQGAFPAAVNVPLLDDEQRHQVGIEYKKAGQQQAIDLGHQLVDKNLRVQRVEAWSRFTEQHPDGCLYCFRGGLRSTISQQWLAEAGVDYPLVAGGYKRMRRFLIETLERCTATLPFVILGGRTGSGKTRLLVDLPRHIDLEALALHRGSSFGKLLKPQPSNIDFENALAIQMLLQEQLANEPTDPSTNPGPALFLEDEGRLIGRVALPVQLCKRMLELPVVFLQEPLHRRIEVSKKDYIVDLLRLYQQASGELCGFEEFEKHHRLALSGIKKRFGQDKVNATLKLFNTAATNHRKTGHTELYNPYIESLLTDYYDPMYDHQFASKQRRILFAGNASEVSEWALAQNPGCAFADTSEANSIPDTAKEPVIE